MKTMLKNCEAGQIVLWQAGIVSFRWLLLAVKGKTSTYQIECEVINRPALVYEPGGRYEVGKKSVWRTETAVTVMSEMEALAWASKT